jgi:DNA segregation ATPase FtsK/SpoIIIE-like protein
MATTEFEEKPRIITPRNSRRNEIVAILLLAVGLLLTLCLVSAAFYPSDPSWNSVGQAETHNWAGTIGAYVSAALFQSIGIAAYLLPFLLLAAAWRRFKTRSFRAPLSRLLGLILLTLAAAALLSISNIHPIFDSTVQPGGMVGTLISRALASGLNTVGAIVLLIALAATGLLLATNFSFIDLYEKVISIFAGRFAFVGPIPTRIKAWRAARREQSRLRKEQRAALKAEQLAARKALKGSLDLSPEERIAQFMKEETTAIDGGASRSESAALQAAAIQGSVEPSLAVAAGVGMHGATVVSGPSGRRSIFPDSPGETAVSDDEPEVEEMV